MAGPPCMLYTLVAGRPNALQRMYGDFLPSLGSPFILYSSSAPANKPFRVADGWTPSD